MNLNEKIQFAHALAKLNVDVIEAGFPIASPGDFEAVRAIAEAADGSIWIATEAGLVRIQDGGHERFTTENSRLPSDDVHALAAPSDGTLWAWTPAGLARVHRGEWTVFTKDKSPLPLPNFGPFGRAPDGAVWRPDHKGGTDGISKLDKAVSRKRSGDTSYGRRKTGDSPPDRAGWKEPYPEK